LRLINHATQRYHVADEGTILSQLPSPTAVGKKGEAAGGDPASLFGHELTRFSTRREVHAFYPAVQAFPEDNFRAACADCLSLQVKQNQSRDRAVRNAYQRLLPCSTGFDE
jgi:hypothetical protein